MRERSFLLRLIFGLLLLSAVSNSAVAETVVEGQPLLDMKMWGEVTADSLWIRTCESRQCPVIFDPRRPSLVRQLGQGNRVKILDSVESEDCVDGNCIWYQIDEGFVSAAYVEFIPHPEPLPGFVCPYGESFCVVVDKSTQSVHLIRDGVDVFRTWVSTGSPNFPSIGKSGETPIGVHRVTFQLKSRWMVGGKKEDNSYYNLPSVPWVTYFTGRGDALHGTYWHARYGTKQSHGCVNMTTYDAGVIYHEVLPGTLVIVQ